MDFEWIDDADHLENFCGDIDEGPVGIDTESDHFHAYQAQVCLFQLAYEGGEALIDPLALDARELAPLFEVLEDPAIVKILHSARNDIGEIDRDYGIGVNNLFDTQIAARFLNTERNSLTWMLEELIGIDIGKEFKRFDWTTRPIPEKAREYALNDVRYLGQLRRGFRKALEEEDWLDPVRQQCQYIADSVTFEANEFDPADWRSINGGEDLDGRGRAALKDLFVWRHELCREKNESAVTLFPNGALLRLARHRPTSPGEMTDLSGVPRELIEDHGEAIAGVIRDSMESEVPPADRPRSDHTSPPPEQSERYHALRKWRNRTAESLTIPPEFIATNDTLTTIAADPPVNKDELMAFQDILPWHGEAFSEDILEVLEGLK